MAESLTRKILAELMAERESGSARQDERYHNRIESKMVVTKKVSGASSSVESKEQWLRRVIDFGRGFYSIAQAAAVTGRSKHSIRQLIRDGRLRKLSFPNTSGEFISGIELTEVVIQHNLNPQMNVVRQKPDFSWKVK